MAASQAKALLVI